MDNDNRTIKQLQSDKMQSIIKTLEQQNADLQSRLDDTETKSISLQKKV